jgi:Tfp pilus assembly protein FimV
VQSETSPANTELQVRYPIKIATTPPVPHSHQSKHASNQRWKEVQEEAREDAQEDGQPEPSAWTYCKPSYKQ